MASSLSLFLAKRYLFSRHQSGFAAFISASSTLGIMLGVCVLIVALSAMNGFERVLAQKLLSIVPHGELINVERPMIQWQDNINQALEHPRVLAGAPVVKSQAMLQKKGQLKGVELRGVDIRLEQQVSDIAQYVNSGSWQDLSQENAIIIGQGIANKLSLSVGDKVQLLLPKIAKQQFGQSFPAPQVFNLTVAGTFKFGGVIDDSLIYLNLSQAQTMLNLSSEQVQGIRLKVDSIFSAPQIMREVANQMTRDYVYIYDWTRTQGHLFSDIQLVRAVMYLALSMVIAVASFNIVSTLIMVVNEKRSDIAILLTMGASPATIMSCFILQGLSNGILGTLLGTGVGLYLADNLTEIVRLLESLFNTQFLSGDVYFINYIPSHIVSSDIIFTVVIALVMSLIATIYPAWRATKVQPAQVLGQA
ncbi:lipoprotein-releasing ABC transporter permease subunit [Thalassotalea sp. LPB0316]|uniref:lipoprotein-releasing ABC transporter permease subunit n=1 Tax=Thalassotalea sp. LPB0316 TaxID=2769490 RepID=UPI001866DFEF|nr:lipoprotein-releasing ABC transporter permease subunit [Thalassotalea sp. LPB0316]QOL24478.1 lipoprotein-releasing ABC transporter permease subunit [Thalassotalea sp. LPB0316]